MSKPNVRVGNKTMQQFQDYDYLDKLTTEESTFLGKFNQEFYAHNFAADSIDNPDRIVDTDSETGKSVTVKQQANNREHGARRDVWNLTQRENLDNIPDADLSDLSTTDVTWEDIYKRDGFEKAMERIADDTLDDLDNANINKHTVLHRYTIKVNKLKRFRDADQRNNGKDKDDEQG